MATAKTAAAATMILPRSLSWGSLGFNVNMEPDDPSGRQRDPTVSAGHSSMIIVNFRRNAPGFGFRFDPVRSYDASAASTSLAVGIAGCAPGLRQARLAATAARRIASSRLSPLSSPAAR